MNLGEVGIKHILSRFIIHFFSAGTIWLLVYYKAAIPLQEWSHVPMVLATSLMMLVISIKEIVDASKRATMISSVLRFLRLDPGQRERVRVALADPRYTLKKSVIDLLGWGAGIGVVIWLSQ